MKQNLAVTRSTRRNTRRGAILMAAILCLLVCTMILISLVQMAAISFRQTRRQTENTQTRWLAESGVSRATARLRADSDYTGETWDIKIDGKPGQVTIKVADDSESKQRRIEVDAKFPADVTTFCRVTRVTTLATETPSPSEGTQESTQGEANPNE